MRTFYQISIAYGVILSDDQIRSLAILLDSDAWKEPFEDEDFINVHDCYDELSSVSSLNDKVHIALASNDFSDIAESKIVLYAPSSLHKIDFMAGKDTAINLDSHSIMWDEQNEMDKIFEMAEISPFPGQIMWSNIS